MTEVASYRPKPRLTCLPNKNDRAIIAEILIKNAEVKLQAAKTKQEDATPTKKYLEQLVSRGQVKRMIQALQAL